MAAEDMGSLLQPVAGSFLEKRGKGGKQEHFIHTLAHTVSEQQVQEGNQRSELQDHRWRGTAKKGQRTGAAGIFFSNFWALVEQRQRGSREGRVDRCCPAAGRG